MEHVSKKETGLKVRVQKLGSSLSSMVMPNIGAFIAWGVITALFIPSGWLPNEALGSLVDPMLKYLLPILIGYTGGNMIFGQRGAVVGAIATMGVIVGADIPMFIGAMIMGPLGGYAIKTFDRYFQEKIKTGFEMLVNNFSAGLIGFALAIIAFFVIGPLVSLGTELMARGVEWIIHAGLLPLANIFIEPAKILFLNNAINHGILTPLGAEQAAQTGKSILFLLEANPGPGLGVLLAFSLFGKGTAKSSAPGAIVIQFLGGIHEIYFPYVMMKPMLILAVIGGGVCGTFTFQLLNAGLRAAASPGSIFAILAMTARGSFFGVIMGVIVGAVVSFFIAAAILKTDRSEEKDLEEMQSSIQQAKAKSKGQLTEHTANLDGIDRQSIKKIIFACDAGMGSSAMGASLLREKVKKAGIDIPVTNSAINQLRDEEDILVVTQEELAQRAAAKVPSATLVTVENFMNSPKYDVIISELEDVNRITHQKEDDVQQDVVLGGQLDYGKIKQIIFACDAGMGSSAMAASLLRKKIKGQDLNISVTNRAINHLENDPYTLVIVQSKLLQRVQKQAPQTMILTVNNFLSSPKYDELIEHLQIASE